MINTSSVMAFCAHQGSVSDKMKVLLFNIIIASLLVCHVSAVGILTNDGDRTSGFDGSLDPAFLDRVRNSFQGFGAHENPGNIMSSNVVDPNTSGSDNLPFQEPVVMDKGHLSFPFDINEWSPWSACVGGLQTRHRSCDVSQCTQSRVCQSMYIDNNDYLTWGDWSSWSGCFLQNGQSRKVRQRQCTNPSHPNCPGVDYDYQDCSSNTNNGLTAWSAWSACNVRGQQFRHRECQGWTCRQVNLSEMQLCSNGELSWSEWSGWSSCINNYRYRNRVCRGSNCVGSNSDTQPCSDRSTVFNGQWSSWESWSNCQDNSQTRSRQCSGYGCVGNPTETKSCTYNPGDESLWSSWNEWSDCDGGNQIRHRTCQGSSRCLGRAYEVRTCSAQPTVGCSSPWGAWSPCTGILQFRHKECPSRRKNCRSVITESRSCFGSSSTFNRRQSCQNPGGWGHQRQSSWGWDAPVGMYSSQSQSQNSHQSWGSTSRESRWESSVAFWGEWSRWTSCKEGHRRRKRVCLANSCDGPTEETSTCYVRFVPGKGPGSIEIPHGKG